MTKLKELRAAAGLTQKLLAEKLGTTQQTVARWESGQTPIPSGTLKEIAALFGSSVAELLGDKRPRPSRTRGPHRHALPSPDPWGTLTMDFAFGSQSYLLDHSNRNALVSFLSEDAALTGMEGWQDFATLDDRCVFFNLAAVRKLRFHKASVDESRKGEDADALTAVRVTDIDGTAKDFALNDDVGRQIAQLDNLLHKVETNAFLAMREAAGAVEILNLSSVATIEVPCTAYYARYQAPEMNEAVPSP